MNNIILIIGKLSPYIFVGIILFIVSIRVIYYNKKMPDMLGKVIEYLRD